ncbi:unnamed protein product [Spirodela intermedia]|uniref:BRCT domain-containing protein n=1 Tax=Spirodela intermedia TaxID=51605 RepID=A0A7I8I909_SPIIN|nr:unnamed protein product [Spirodela intermedia]CAA6654018.1 unnamed protein product [Spirodela intermedia]
MTAYLFQPWAPQTSGSPQAFSNPFSFVLFCFVDSTRNLTTHESCIKHLYGLKSSCRGIFLVKDCSFQMLNPKDIDSRSRTLVQEVLNIYMKELPSMNYAANTGKRSTFLEKCVSGGKYKTMVLRTDSTKENGEVIAAISFQIIASDALYSEIPLAAVCSEHQRKLCGWVWLFKAEFSKIMLQLNHDLVKTFNHKGIGQLLYSELRKRLQSVGILTIFCWADKESKGFWAKQGFTSIGDVDGKGRVRRLPVRASVRKALCFPGDSTLMVSQLKKDVVQPGLTPCATKLLGHTNMVPDIVPYLLIGVLLVSMMLEMLSLWIHHMMHLNMLFTLISHSIVEELGGSVTSDGWFCTHVITGRHAGLATSALHCAPGQAWVVSSSWLKESYREKRFVGESGFILEDEHYMSKYKSTLRDAVIKARENPRSLLKGYSVIRGVLNTLEPSKTIFIACEEDMEDALLAAKKGIWTFSSDWFMSCIMRQELDFDSPQFSESL